MARPTLKRLSQQLKQVDARWSPLEAPLKTRPALGYVPGPPNRPLTGPGSREEAASHGYRLYRAGAALRAKAQIPRVVDWRYYPGGALPAGSYVTNARDQKTCGSCVAFGTVATLEAAVRIQKKSPALTIDLAEADLFFCHGGVPNGPTCDTGWYPEAALTSVQKAGVVDEACFGYTPKDQPCKKCEDWKKRVTKIKRWSKVTSTTEMKSLLAAHGPLITCMSVYEDFFQYQEGVYHHVTGGLAGGHCICCVGYDERKHAWICKNSWGPDWGESGFFMIAYGECGIDASMWALEV